MNRQIHKYSEVREKILHAVDTIADPIRATISPMGMNVLFENDNGNYVSTNDGVTIAKNISVSDPVEDLVIGIIKGSSLKTNSEVGDGTSTSILLSQILIKEGLRLIENGYKPSQLKKELTTFAEQMKDRLKAISFKVKTDKDLENIASISANNDLNIAKDIVKVVKTAGLDGMVFLEPNNKPKTDIIEDTGFMISTGLFSPEFVTNQTSVASTYVNIPTIIIDKRLYYPEEAETILKTVLMSGYKQVVIVARDFIGQCINVFTANHIQKKIDILLVKDTDSTDKNSESLYDLATYLGGKVVSEKTGSLVDKISIKDFVIVSKVFQDRVKTIISTDKKKNKELEDKITSIRNELDDSPDSDKLKKRLASLTNGMVTLKIGANTPIEMAEKIYRYEDAINATRAAMRDGFLVGGGVSMLRAFNPSDYPTELVPLFRKVCEGNIRQIAENCGEHGESIVRLITENKNLNWGYNALTGKMVDLLKDGVVDPYKVTEMSLINAVSIAQQILGSNFINVIERENNEERNKKSK